MSLATGDLTTQQRLATWLAASPTLPSSLLAQLITSMTALIYGKLHRSRLFSQSFTRTFSGVGTAQLVLPDWPVTSVQSVQIGQAVIPQSVIPPQGQSQPAGTTLGFGYRYVPWAGDLPGSPSVLDLANGFFYMGPQNVTVTYTAGYLISNEAWTVPTTGGGPPPIAAALVVTQPLGVWCRDNGVTYTNGTALVAVASAPTVGQYIPPNDNNPGLYQFAAADIGASVLISYSFVPADLEEACIQMVAERYSYRQRIGEVSKSLGGQETIRYARGSMGPPWNRKTSLPPEVMDLINSYISVLPPPIGAPV